MIREGIGWAIERARKSAEFEIEGGLWRLAAERAPHACSVALGCTVLQGQIYLACGAVLVFAVVIVIVRRRHKHEEKTDPWESEL